MALSGTVLFCETRLKIGLSMQWIPFPDPRLTVSGLPFFEENRPHLGRFPGRLESSIRRPLWEIAECPAGGRIRLASDTGSLAIRLEHQPQDRKLGMPVGPAGFDLYADDRYWTTSALNETGTLELLLFSGVSRRRRDLSLYLPLFQPVKVLALGVDTDATLDAPRPFAYPKPVVFYGGSLTQGSCASRAGMAYPSILGRELNLDTLNFGLAGLARGEKALAQLLAEIDAQCYVLDFARDCADAEALREAYPQFLAALRQQRPETPIVAVTPAFDAAEHYNAAMRERIEEFRQVIRNTAAARRVGGETKLTLLEGHDILGPKHDEGLVDGMHPNDLGFQAIAQGMKLTLRKLLRARPGGPA